MSFDSSKREETSEGPGLRRAWEGSPPVVRTEVLLLLGGTALFWFTAAFPPSEDTPVTACWILGGVLAPLGLVSFLWGEMLPTWMLHADVAISVVAVSILIALAATPLGLAVTILPYTWLSVFVGHFFPHRLAMAHVAFASAAFGVALLFGKIGTGLTLWVVFTATIALTTEALSRISGQLRSMAQTDPLTGLLNRNGLKLAADQMLALSDRTGEPVCVALIDLDEFKAINDRHGHEAGDDVLVRTARGWSSEVRAADLIARYGGDEFVLIMPSTDLPEAERLLGRLADSTVVGWSHGLVRREREEDLDRCLIRADRILYRSKSVRA